MFLIWEMFMYHCYKHLFSLNKSPATQPHGIKSNLLRHRVIYWRGLF